MLHVMTYRTGIPKTISKEVIRNSYPPQKLEWNGQSTCFQMISHWNMGIFQLAMVVSWRADLKRIGRHHEDCADLLLCQVSCPRPILSKRDSMGCSCLHRAARTGVQRPGQRRFSPTKNYMIIEKTLFLIGDTSSNGWLFIVIWLFGGVIYI